VRPSLPLVRETPAAFQARVEAGTGRHVGLTESVALRADAMGWKAAQITDTIHPVLARQRVASDFLTVAPGMVCGRTQDGKTVITLPMEADLGAPES
jgi:hypothetical protein